MKSGIQMFVFSFEDFVLNFNQFEHDIAWCTDHSFVAHICVTKLWVTRCSWFYSQFELLNSWDNLLRLTNVAFSSNNLSLTLASWTGLSEQVIVSSTQIYSSLSSSLSTAFPALYNIIWVLSPSSVAMRTRDLFFDHNVKLFSKVKVFKL
jgi:hypothetical protein